MPRHAETDADTINAVLEEGGKFAAEVTFPLNIERRQRRLQAEPGDARGHHAQGLQGSLRAVRRRRAGPRSQLRSRIRRPGPAVVVNQCFYEMLNSANQAWTMYPGLSHGAYAALNAHGTDEQKKTYLPKLISGEWTGTMCLTEAALRHRPGHAAHQGRAAGRRQLHASPATRSSSRAGEHDMAGNIIHLVLARLPDAPQGSKGISLFIVPKFTGQRRRLAGRAQRHLLRRPGTQDGHPRQRHRADRAGWRHRHGWSASPTRACRRCS